MTYPIGSILLIKNYQLPSTRKDKFFIVIGEKENEYNLLSMTTSIIYFKEELIRHGKIEDRDISVYCFEKDKVIGKQGFSFLKHTIISHRTNIHHFTSQKIAALQVELLDILTDEELQNLIYSFYKYKGTPKKHVGFFEELLTKISR
jgi:hypothetical protein